MDWVQHTSGASSTYARLAGCILSWWTLQERDRNEASWIEMCAERMNQSTHAASICVVIFAGFSTKNAIMPSMLNVDRQRIQ